MNPRERAEKAWADARLLRSMTESTMNRQQRAELDALLKAWRHAHLCDCLAVGAEAFYEIAKKQVGP